MTTTFDDYPDAAKIAERIRWHCDTSGKARRTQDGWQLPCPTHEDDTPSLSLSVKEDKVLLHCFAGCATEAIVHAIGMKMTDLFVTPKHLGKRILKTYDYRDPSGTLAHQTLRLERKGGRKDTFSQRRPHPTRPGTWIDDLADVTTLLYHLPEVNAAIARGEPIYVVEGEKDADNLMALGLTATCNPMGGSKGKIETKWPPRFTDVLRGARVVLLPDYDETGTTFTAGIAQRLHGTAAEIKIVPGVHTDATGSDVSDWLAAGHTREELEALVEQTPRYAPETTVTLMMSKEKKPYRVLGNVLEVLTQDPSWQGVLGYNAFADEVVFLKRPPCSQDAEPWKGKPLEDQDDAEIANWLHWQYELFAPTTVVHEAVQAAAHRNPFHPIRDYLARLKWDQTPRLDRWLSRYCGVADSAYARAVAASTLIGAVARVQDPGAKMDTVTILFGKQGTRKSTTWRVLCGDAWFSDTMGDLHDKDAMMALRGKWIIEFGDLAAVHRSEIETVKRFVSATQDYYRPSYGRRPRTFLRQNIFVGSTNRPDALKDDTGNRRFYIVTTTGICDTEALDQDRNQLWAEAAHRYHTGELWYLDAMMAEVAAQVQADHMEHDPWEETVLEYVTPYAGTQHVTTKQIMCEAFLWVNPDKWTLANTRRIGAILHRHGWQNSRPRDPQGKQYAAFWHPLDRPPVVTDGTEAPWPLGVGNAVTDSRIGNTIGNTQSPHEIRPATDVTDVTDHFSHTQAQQNNQAAQHNQAALYKYGDPIGNIGNIGNKRIPTSGNAGTDAVTDGRIGNTTAPAPCQHLDTSLQGAGLVCTRCGAALF